MFRNPFRQEINPFNLVDRPFKDRATAADVTAAYRLLLGRNPDRSGYQSYQKLIEEGLTVSRLYEAFSESVEFIQQRAADRLIQEIDCGGYWVCVRQGEKDFGQAIIRQKTWEPHILKLMGSLLKEGQTVVDIGANVGMMSFLAANTVGSQGQVIAVEPNPDNLQLLYAGIVRNGFDQVRVLPFAASDRVAIFAMDGGTSNSFIKPAEKNRPLVQSIVLDDALGHLERIDLVKIDIEGHEPAALAGFDALLRHHKPPVLVEFNPRCLADLAGCDPQAALEQYFALFQTLEVIDHAGRRTPFTRPTDLWGYWQEQNQKAVRQKRLPDGLLHLDCLGHIKS